MKQRDHIEFNPDNHTYRNVITDNYYTSITTWIKKHKYPFVADAENTAKTMRELNMTFDEVVAYWAKKGTDSTDRGTWIHNTIETYLKNEGAYYETEVSIVDSELAIEWEKEVPFDYLDTLLKKRCTLHIEDLLYLDTWGIAGQADLVLEYKNHLEIEDWKTNTKTLEELKRVWWKTPKFKELFTDLPQCSFNEYAIQLVLYGMMAEKIYGKPCKKHTINHIYQGFNQYVIDKKLVNKIKKKLKFLFE